MKTRGFTVVELLIVITVMAILLTLAVVNVRSAQANARDAERRTDVENIALTLESFYNATHTVPGSPSFDLSRSYPSTTATASADPANWIIPYIEQRTPAKSLYAPGVDHDGPPSLVVATNNATNPTLVVPEPTLTTYVYQPLSNDPYNVGAGDALCTSFVTLPCNSFTIYYLVEQPSSECPANICVYRSNHQ